MRKLITILMTIMTLLAIISCNGSTPQGTPELTVKLEKSAELKETVTAVITLIAEDKTTTEISLTESKNSVTNELLAGTYIVDVQESKVCDFEYDKTITIKAGGNSLVIKAVPKSASGNTDDPINPTITTGILSIDFCNFFGATMHYDIYNSYSIDPIISADTDKDTKIELEPGSYYISASLVGDPSDLKLWTTNEDDSPSDPADKHSFSIEKGQNTLSCFKITNENKSGNARVAINPTYGKELLGNPNEYGDDVSISYSFKYINSEQVKSGTKVYDDYLIDMGMESVSFTPEFSIRAINSNGDDVSGNYVLICPRMYVNDSANREILTRCICIYRGCKVEFRINEPLEENQVAYISCEQLGKTLLDTKLAYDKPFDVTCYIKTKEGTIVSQYCEYENMKISEGDSTVIILERNIN